MIHFFALLTDLIADSQCLHTLALRVSSFGLANSAMILLFGMVQMVRRWKLRSSLPTRA